MLFETWATNFGRQEAKWTQWELARAAGLNTTNNAIHVHRISSVNLQLAAVYRKRSNDAGRCCSRPGPPNSEDRRRNGRSGNWPEPPGSTLPTMLYMYIG